VQQLAQFPRGAYYSGGLAAGKRLAQRLHQAVFDLRNYLQPIHSGLI
jgi:hypothetical protein